MQLFGLVALFLSIVWMLRDEKDKTRPVLVFALLFNLIYFWLMRVVLKQEDTLLAWKFDDVLFHLDQTLGITTATIARPLQGVCRIPLWVIYQLMVPMMILWFPVTRGRSLRAALVLAYVAELVMGPLLYSVVPALGPAYVFGAKWLHPPAAPAQLIRLAGMPNAFPSLHMGTALLLLLFARGKWWRGVALVFLAGTALATLSTGEHYVIDLAPGMAFGCFAASAGFRRFRNALLYLGVVVSWSLAIRFQYAWLIRQSGVVRACVALTVAMVVAAVWMEWRRPKVEDANLPLPAPTPSSATA